MLRFVFYQGVLWRLHVVASLETLSGVRLVDLYSDRLAYGREWRGLSDLGCGEQETVKQGGSDDDTSSQSQREVVVDDVVMMIITTVSFVWK